MRPFSSKVGIERHRIGQWLLPLWGWLLSASASLVPFDQNQSLFAPRWILGKKKKSCTIDLFHNELQQVVCHLLLKLSAFLLKKRPMGGHGAVAWFELPFHFLLGYIYRICFTPDRITVALSLPSEAFWLAHATDIQIHVERPAKCHNVPPIDSKPYFIKCQIQFCRLTDFIRP